MAFYDTKYYAQLCEQNKSCALKVFGSQGCVKHTFVPHEDEQ